MQPNELKARNSLQKPLKLIKAGHNFFGLHELICYFTYIQFHSILENWCQLKG
jgi:hypothetical protein